MNTLEQEILQVLNQIPGAIEKAFLDAMVLRHPGHANQKTHGNRFGGYSTTKESLRRLKGDKAAREAYKQTVRKRQGDTNAKDLTFEDAQKVLPKIKEQPVKYKPVAYEVDWGNSMRGQGKRIGGQTLGAMGDALHVRGKKQYFDPFGALPERHDPEFKKDLPDLISNPHLGNIYIRARSAGYNRRNAMMIAEAGR